MTLLQKLDKFRKNKLYWKISTRFNNKRKLG